MHSGKKVAMSVEDAEPNCTVQNINLRQVVVGPVLMKKFQVQ
jgi:hypothetical protein